MELWLGTDNRNALGSCSEFTSQARDSQEIAFDAIILPFFALERRLDDASSKRIRL